MTPRPDDSPHPNPSPEGEGLKETKAVAGWVLDQILVMLHPFMPFVTEELWHSMGERKRELIVAKWPEPGVAVDAEAKREVDWLIDFTQAVRSMRADLGVPFGVNLDCAVDSTDQDLADRFQRNESAIKRLNRIEDVQFDFGNVFAVAQSRRQSLNVYGALMLHKVASAQVVVRGITYVFPLEGVIDIAAEIARLTKALEASTKEAKSLAGRLANPAFVEKAKPEAVDKARADHDHHAAEAERLAAALARLG